MPSFILLILGLLSTFSYAKKGPQPHERTDLTKMESATVGRYIYLGEVPKFNSSELEITISKMNLTARVTAHVTQERIEGYAHQLFQRWKRFNDALMFSEIGLHPITKISKLAEKSPANVKAWSKIAEQYSSHFLEKSGQAVYSNHRHVKGFSDAKSTLLYKETISKAYFQTLFNTKASPDTIFSDNRRLEQLLSISNSKLLFQHHLGSLFTKGGSSKPGYLGTLTFVYPISGSTEGPFDIPSEKESSVITSELMDARWWSDRWNDAFGGFPFILLDWNGVAFHGPINNYRPLDVWYLQRGFVSHGCLRMDPSDLLELRMLMPSAVKKSKEKIKLTILDYFDVTDWNKDAKNEVVDVLFYKIPSAIMIAPSENESSVVAPYLVESQKKSFIQNNSFAKKYYDSILDQFVKIPKYSLNNGVLKRSGVHEQVSIYRFPHRKNRIIQYEEAGVRLEGFDDLAGRFPPQYFLKY